MKEYSNIENIEVPQIHPQTGISQDYSGEFESLVHKSKGIDFVKYMLKTLPSPFHMKKYEEYFAGCKDIVTEKNKDSVKRINELANKMNEITKDPDTLNEADFRKTYNELLFLIYGDRSRDI